MGGIRGPGVARGRIGKIRHIKTGDNFHHPRNLLRLACVNVFYQAVGDCGMKNLANQGIAVYKIIGVPCPARNFFPSVNPGYALTNAHKTLYYLYCVTILMKKQGR
jgi:hypothetical protein